MTNIWEFLLQTAEVSITAAIILVVKGLFADKLSPRWQYAVWILLACKILLPARLMGRYLSVTLAAGIEAIKMTAESTLSSAYSQQWIPIGQNTSVLPFVNKAPESVTDWLFVLYVMGVLISLLYYGLSYVRLRRILRSKRAEAVLLKKVEETCARYALSGCEVVTAEGIPSAFVCGFFRPLLVVPEGQILMKRFCSMSFCIGPMRMLCRMHFGVSCGHCTGAIRFCNMSFIASATTWRVCAIRGFWRNWKGKSAERMAKFCFL